MFHPATPISVLAFVLICFVVLGAFVGGVWNSALRENVSPLRRTLPVAIGTAIWLSLICGLTASGWPETNPGRTLLFMGSINLVSLAIGLSPLGGWLAGSSLRWLVAFQAFRLTLELVLHAWAAQGVIPQSMTWSGANWDIVTGILALAFAPFVRRFVALAWAVNGIGLLLLANVIRVAVMSSPVPFGWPVTPKLALIYHVPYVLILPVCVGGALIGHLALTRALLARSNGPPGHVPSRLI
jgi:hypothetical protein